MWMTGIDPLVQKVRPSTLPKSSSSRAGESRGGQGPLCSLRQLPACHFAFRSGGRIRCKEKSANWMQRLPSTDLAEWLVQPQIEAYPDLIGPPITVLSLTAQGAQFKKRGHRSWVATDAAPR
jgi:hypothetical protein